MVLQTSVSQVLFRGATILFSTTFRDQYDNIIQPLGAFVNVVYFAVGEGSQQTVGLTMSPPATGQVQWTAQWDSRGAGYGPVQYSVHCTGPSPPYSVEDNMFILAANNANLVTF
jgi:hypothetical protein